jgi:aminotransferase
MQLAAGLEDVISFGAGDPDLSTPPEIIRTAVECMGADCEESPVRGLTSLREALATHYGGTKEVDLDPEEEILITNGAQEALFLSMLLLVNPGDRVLVPDPRYSSYDQAIEAAGGEIVAIPTGIDQKFELGAAALQNKTRGCKLLIHVNPANPTGALLSAEGVQELAALARSEDLLVVADEVYEGLVYDGAPFLSMIQCEGMGNRSVTLSSFSKTYAMTGFRVGYLIGPPKFIQAAARLKQITSGPCPVFSQYAGLAALTGSTEASAEIHRIFSGRRRAMMKGLDSLQIPYGHPGGTFFMWADISRFGLPSEEFCRRLLLERRVLFFPGTAFGQRWKLYVRISILQSEERIAEAIERVRNFIGSIPATSSGGA